MRITRRLVIATVVAMVGLTLAAASAVAGVERYQYTVYLIEVSSVNGNSNYAHGFVIHESPCDGSFTGSGYAYTHDGTESLSNFDKSGDTLSFRADYDFNDYYWFPSFTLNGDNTLTFHDGYGADNVNAATGTWLESRTDYNHGEFVAENIEEYGSDAARSCIGMPVVSSRAG